MLVGCISLILPLCCLAANLKNEEPVNNRALARSFLSGLLDKINSGQFIDMFAAGDVVAKVKKHVTEAECIGLLKEFEKDLSIIESVQTNTWKRTEFMIASVWNAYSALWRCSPGLTEKERWVIKFKALEWEYRQLNWLKQVAPEDTRPLIQKRNNPRAPYRTEYGKWQHTVQGVESTFYKRHIAKSVYEAEREQYSNEFRAWCFKEIEKIIGRPLTDDDIMFKEDVLRRRAKRLINRIPSSWKESVEAFTNVAYKACEAISKIDNPTKRLECAIAYGESLFKLDRFVRECDVQGYWARINAHGMAKDILHELDVESKWIHAAKYRQLMKEELKYYEPLGSSTPMRMLKRNRWNEKEYEVLSKENEKRGKALKYRHFANKIKGGLQAFYKPAFEWSLKEDCSNLTSERKKALMKMVIEITGETPKWYQKELSEKKKTGDM
jgi:hypothetical protein